MSLWSCTTCFKSFSRKGDLTRHKSLHTGIKPHVCETCGKGFAQFSGLKTHRNVHSREKPYICGIGTCTKAFGDPSSRARHRKETHRREGAYKCIVTDCGTRIKRRSTFVAHLRKHGLDPNSLDLEAIVVQSRESGIPMSTQFASPPARDRKLHPKVEPWGAIPSFPGDSSGYYTLGSDGEAGSFADNSGWSDNDPLDCRRANWPPANDALLPGSVTGQIVNDGPSGFPDIYTYLTGDFKNPFSSDGIFPAADDYPPLVTSRFSIPVLGPFLEAGSDGSRSSSSSPSTTYSALYSTDFNDMALLPLAHNASQESLLYNIM